MIVNDEMRADLRDQLCDHVAVKTPKWLRRRQQKHLSGFEIIRRIKHNHASFQVTYHNKKIDRVEILRKESKLGTDNRNSAQDEIQKLG